MLAGAYGLAEIIIGGTMANGSAVTTSDSMIIYSVQDGDEFSSVAQYQQGALSRRDARH